MASKLEGEKAVLVEKVKDYEASMRKVHTDVIKSLIGIKNSKPKSSIPNLKDNFQIQYHLKRYVDAATAMIELQTQFSNINGSPAITDNDALVAYVIASNPMSTKNLLLHVKGYKYVTFPPSGPKKVSSPPIQPHEDDLPRAVKEHLKSLEFVNDVKQLETEINNENFEYVRMYSDTKESVDDKKLTWFKFLQKIPEIHVKDVEENPNVTLNNEAFTNDATLIAAKETWKKVQELNTTLKSKWVELETLKNKNQEIVNLLKLKKGSAIKVKEIISRLLEEYGKFTFWFLNKIVKMNISDITPSFKDELANTKKSLMDDTKNTNAWKLTMLIIFRVIQPLTEYKITMEILKEIDEAGFHFENFSQILTIVLDEKNITKNKTVILFTGTMVDAPTAIDATNSDKLSGAYYQNHIKEAFKYLYGPSILALVGFKVDFPLNLYNLKTTSFKNNNEADWNSLTSINAFNTLGIWDKSPLTKMFSWEDIYVHKNLANRAVNNTYDLFTRIKSTIEVNKKFIDKYDLSEEAIKWKTNVMDKISNDASNTYLKNIIESEFLHSLVQQKLKTIPNLIEFTIEKFQLYENTMNDTKPKYIPINEGNDLPLIDVNEWEKVKNELYLKIGEYLGKDPSTLPIFTPNQLSIFFDYFGENRPFVWTKEGMNAKEVKKRKETTKKLNATFEMELELWSILRNMLEVKTKVKLEKFMEVNEENDPLFTYDENTGKLKLSIDVTESYVTKSEIFQKDNIQTIKNISETIKVYWNFDDIDISNPKNIENYFRLNAGIVESFATKFTKISENEFKLNNKIDLLKLSNTFFDKTTDENEYLTILNADLNDVLKDTKDFIETKDSYSESTTILFNGISWLYATRNLLTFVSYAFTSIFKNYLERIWRLWEEFKDKLNVIHETVAKKLKSINRNEDNKKLIELKLIPVPTLEKLMPILYRNKNTSETPLIKISQVKPSKFIEDIYLLQSFNESFFIPSGSEWIKEFVKLLIRAYMRSLVLSFRTSNRFFEYEINNANTVGLSTKLSKHMFFVDAYEYLKKLESVEGIETNFFKYNFSREAFHLIDDGGVQSYNISSYLLPEKDETFNNNEKYQQLFMRIQNNLSLGIFDDFSLLEQLELKKIPILDNCGDGNCLYYSLENIALSNTIDKTPQKNTFEESFAFQFRETIYLKIIPKVVFNKSYSKWDDLIQEWLDNKVNEINLPFLVESGQIVDQVSKYTVALNMMNAFKDYLLANEVIDPSVTEIVNIKRNTKNFKLNALDEDEDWIDYIMAVLIIYGYVGKNRKLIKKDGNITYNKILEKRESFVRSEQLFLPLQIFNDYLEIPTLVKLPEKIRGGVMLGNKINSAFKQKLFLKEIKNQLNDYISSAREQKTITNPLAFRGILIQTLDDKAIWGGHYKNYVNFTKIQNSQTSTYWIGKLNHFVTKLNNEVNENLEEIQRIGAHPPNDWEELNKLFSNLDEPLIMEKNEDFDKLLGFDEFRESDSNGGDKEGYIEHEYIPFDDTL